MLIDELILETARRDLELAKKNKRKEFYYENGKRLDDYAAIEYNRRMIEKAEDRVRYYEEKARRSSQG